MAYGVPRWIGAVLDVMGRRSASFVNYDLFESQGIPPLAVLVSGGVLTDESLDELKTLLRSLRGEDKWNRVMVLESNVESLGLEEKGTAKIELKNLSEYRKEDLMFDKYLGNTHDNCRHRFRFPPLYTGSAETFTHATAKAAQNVAEEQVFIPERGEFDETINRKIVQNELGIDMWSFATKGPRIVGSEELSKGVSAFVSAGAVSVNNAIQLANRAFNLQMSQYNQPWAELPIVLIIKAIEAGAQLQGVGRAIEQPALEVGSTPVPVQKSLPYLPQKVFKSDMFNEDEKKLYKRLLLLQTAVESIPEDEWDHEHADL